MEEATEETPHFLPARELHAREVSLPVSGCAFGFTSLGHDLGHPIRALDLRAGDVRQLPVQERQRPRDGARDGLRASARGAARGAGRTGCRGSRGCRCRCSCGGSAPLLLALLSALLRLLAGGSCTSKSRCAPANCDSSWDVRSCSSDSSFAWGENRVKSAAWKCGKPMSATSRHRGREEGGVKIV